MADFDFGFNFTPSTTEEKGDNARIKRPEGVTVLPGLKASAYPFGDIKPVYAKNASLPQLEITLVGSIAKYVASETSLLKGVPVYANGKVGEKNLKKFVTAFVSTKSNKGFQFSVGMFNSIEDILNAKVLDENGKELNQTLRGILTVSAKQVSGSTSLWAHIEGGILTFVNGNGTNNNKNIFCDVLKDTIAQKLAEYKVLEAEYKKQIEAKKQANG